MTDMKSAFKNIHVKVKWNQKCGLKTLKLILRKFTKSRITANLRAYRAKIDPGHGL